jgi:hypothetical protein
MDYAYDDRAPAPNTSVPSGAHFDERIKTSSADTNPSKKHLIFMANYFSSDKAGYGYLAFNGSLIPMSLIFGNEYSGTWEYATTMPPSNLPCMPYYFVFLQPGGSFSRLPQDPRYYFGTSWTNYSWWKVGVTANTPYPCGENHYFEGSSTLSANGGVSWSGTEYNGLSGGACIGCGSIADIKTVGQPYPAVFPPNTSAGSRSCSFDFRGVVMIVLLLLILF